VGVFGQEEISLMGNEMDKNKEYQCVMGCFQLNDQSRKTAGKNLNVPDCTIDVTLKLPKSIYF
jgi:hypothetical protein